jgi:hypothetical protein
MAKSKQSQERAKAFVSPLFSAVNAVLKGGEMVLDSMQAAAKNANSVRVAAIRDADAPPRKRSAPVKSKSRKRRAKKRSR